MKKAKIDRILVRNKKNRDNFLQTLAESDGAAEQTDEEIVSEPVEPVEDDLPTIEA